jgi:hypothetical protein
MTSGYTGGATTAPSSAQMRSSSLRRRAGRDEPERVVWVRERMVGSTFSGSGGGEHEDEVLRRLLRRS